MISVKRGQKFSARKISKHFILQPCPVYISGSVNSAKATYRQFSAFIPALESDNTIRSFRGCLLKQSNCHLISLRRKAGDCSADQCETADINWIGIYHIHQLPGFSNPEILQDFLQELFVIISPSVRDLCRFLE